MRQLANEFGAMCAQARNDVLNVFDGEHAGYLFLLYEYGWWIVVALPPDVRIPDLTETASQ